MQLESDTTSLDKKAQAAPPGHGENTPLSLIGVTSDKSVDGFADMPSNKLGGKAMVMSDALVTQSLAQGQVKAAKVAKESELASTAIDMTSSLTAGVGGTVAFSLARSTALGKVAVPLAMVAGGVLKYGSKTGLEHAFIQEDKRTASYKDVAWGAVDAVAGIGASVVERTVAAKYFTNLGKKELGSAISTPVA